MVLDLELLSPFYFLEINLVYVYIYKQGFSGVSGLVAQSVRAAVM